MLAKSGGELEPQEKYSREAQERKEQQMEPVVGDDVHIRVEMVVTYQGRRARRDKRRWGTNGYSCPTR